MRPRVAVGAYSCSGMKSEVRDSDSNRLTGDVGVGCTGSPGNPTPPRRVERLHLDPSSHTPFSQSSAASASGGPPLAGAFGTPSPSCLEMDGLTLEAAPNQNRGVWGNRAVEERPCGVGSVQVKAYLLPAAPGPRRRIYWLIRWLFTRHPSLRAGPAGCWDLTGGTPCPRPQGPTVWRRRQVCRYLPHCSAAVPWLRGSARWRPRQ